MGCGCVFLRPYVGSLECMCVIKVHERRRVDHAAVTREGGGSDTQWPHGTHDGWISLGTQNSARDGVERSAGTPCGR